MKPTDYVYIIIVAAAVVYYAYGYFKKKQKKRNENKNNVPAVSVKPNGKENPQISNAETGDDYLNGTRDALLEILQKLNCDPQVSEDSADNHIGFAYQGEKFLVSASNDAAFVHFYDLGWEAVEMNNIDELSRYRKAVNNVNINMPVTLYYTYDTEDTKQLTVHTSMSVLMLKDMPHLQDYVVSILGLFFTAHREFTKELDEMRRNNE